ncbi:uncharacterized protein TM35_000191150 [Trypanosoma theileri]|uniref:Uncharacterized protein n=1 Tax=Trypanosoma theileri TaxID=67003 RepID=A0A1X0NTE1_9TRYP|nr:uncharacterized protein TM35_000191150 [Trypanosoma theileri]ORC87871.1 hypothetical protein TM35_000191150 [Trypanosoma theileri]
MNAPERNGNHTTIVDQVNQCVETGRNAVTSAKQRVLERAEAGRERAGELAQAGREQLDGAIQSAARVRAVADEYVENGKRVLQEARETAKNTVEPLVDNARTLAETSTKRIEETRAAVQTSLTNVVNTSRPRFEELRTSSTNALKTRDPHLLVSVAAQFVAFVLFVLNLLVVELCKVKRVKSAVVYVQESTLTKKAVDFVKWVDVPRRVESVPFVGKRLVSVATTFVEEVKANMAPKVVERRRERERKRASIEKEK